jgi:hypothetical protein
MIKHKDGTITHVGLVHSLSYSESSAMDTYVRITFALVYNIETKALDKIELSAYANDNHHEYAEAEVDLLPEYRTLYESKIAADRKAYHEAQEAKTPRKGKFATINRGRKAKGQTGVIFWVGQCKFNRGQTNIGINLGNEKVFVNAEYCTFSNTALEKALKEA